MHKKHMQIYKTYAKIMQQICTICNKYAQYATNMQQICKIEGWPRVVGNITELDAVGCQFKPTLPLVKVSA